MAAECSRPGKKGKGWSLSALVQGGKAAPKAGRVVCLEGGGKGQFGSGGVFAGGVAPLFPDHARSFRLTQLPLTLLVSGCSANAPRRLPSVGRWLEGIRETSKERLAGGSRVLDGPTAQASRIVACKPSLRAVTTRA